jgi:2,5-diketo-D-gluconate reductase B
MRSFAPQESRCHKVEPDETKDRAQCSAGTIGDTQRGNRNHSALMPAAVHDIPRIGLGTFTVTGDIGVAAMIEGLELGYRHIDTAQSYGNESEVGEALERSRLEHSEIFVTTKVSTRNLSKDRLAPSIRESAERLRVDQIDLVLVHWPPGEDGPRLVEYMEALAKAKADGLTRLIGVSNFTRRLIDEAINVVGPGQIANNQVELHPYLQNRALRDHMARLGISVTAYMPIAGGKVTRDPLIVAMARRLNAAPAQVALAWLMQEGVNVIPSSTKRAHLESNLQAASLTLSKADIKSIETLDVGLRLIDGSFAPEWD